MKKIAMVCLVCCLMVSAAFAQNNDRNFLIGGTIGAFVPSEDELYGLDTEIGAAISIDGQYFFNKYIGMGFFVLWNDWQLEETKLGGVEYDRDLSTTIVGVSLIARVPLGKVDIYGLAGIGAGLIDYDYNYEIGNITYSESQNDVNLAYRFEGGIRYHITDAFSLGLSGGYLINEAELEITPGVEEDVKLDGFYGGLTWAVAF